MQVHDFLFNKSQTAVSCVKLVREHQRGSFMDKDSFSALYNASRKELYGYCRKLCGNSHDADDLMQQTYLKAWQNFDKFDGRNLSSWLCSIARNTFLNNLRNVRNESLIDEYEEIPDNSTNPEFITEKKYIYGILLKALKNYLSPAQRMTVILYYYDEKSVSEISGIMHCPKGTVESRLCSAREKLRRELKKSGNIFTYLVFVSTVFRHKLKNIHIPVNARITVSAVVTAAAMVSVSMASIPPENKLPDTVITINETHTSENLTTTENKTVIQTSSEMAFIAPVSHAGTNSIYTVPADESRTTAFKSEYEDIQENVYEELTEETYPEEGDTPEQPPTTAETVTEYKEVTTMKKEIISAVTALTTAFAGMTATTAAADISDSMIYSPPSWGSITTNLSISEMEKLVSEYYGQSYKEWAIYGYSEVFDGVNVKVFQAENNIRGNVVAVYNGTSIYMTTENKTEIENFINENYPDYNIDEEYNENGYNLRIWTYDYDESGKDIPDICNKLKEKDLISAFDYKIGGYSLHGMVIPEYLTGYPTDFSDKKADELMQKLNNFVKNNNLNFSVVLFDKQEMKQFGNGEDVSEMPSYVDSEGKYPYYFDMPVVCVIPNEGVSAYEHSEVARKIYEELGLGQPFGWEQSVSGSIGSESEHIDVFNAVSGDANNDGRMSISDSVAILQYISNMEKYPLSVQGKYNADCDSNDGITGLDASYIQHLEATQS